MCIKIISPLFTLLFLTVFTFQIFSLENETFSDRKKSPYLVNLHISKEKKFVWFRVLKVASGSIKTVLKNDVPDLFSERLESVPKKFDDYYKFAFVRNPWDRVVSYYFYKIDSKKSKKFKECFDKDFDYFIDYIDKLDVATIDRHIALQTRLIPVDQCDFIGKVDNFTKDLQYVCDVLGIKMGEIPYRHKTDHIHYSTYYTPRTREIIARKYKEDIERFGFEFKTK